MKNSKFLITGATGLIGGAIVHHVLNRDPNTKVILPVRNIDKAKSMFGRHHNIQLYECDLLTTDFEFAGDVDYIIHCAAPTDSRFFVEHPVETYNAICSPSLHLLEYATRHSIKGFVYLSSLEVYGTINDGDGLIGEEELGYIDLTSVRSCYPLAKRAVEHLCRLYAVQYGIPVSVARLTQTTGSNVPFSDNRVINAFCRSAAENKDIVLFTKGDSSRPYCHVDDAVEAILLLLQKGERGIAYNVANESTYISAYNLALYIQEHHNQSISVRREIKDDVPFAPPSHLRLSTSRLQSLGWKPTRGLEDICRDVYNHYKPTVQDGR